MKVNKLHLHDYGQFHEKDITLAPGINVLYGANEAGKSTAKDFLVDMLYGIYDLDDFGKPNDHYEKKKPIGRDAYCGSLEVDVNGTEYLIYRNFDKNQRETTVKNLDTGSEVSLATPHSLVGTLFQTDRSTYMNTLCISHLGAATDSSIVDKLNDYVINMASTQNGELDAVDAIVQLKNKKGEFSNEELEKRQQELSELLTLDRDFDAEIAQVRQEYANLKENGGEPAKLQFTPIKNPATEEMLENEKQEEDVLEEEPKVKLSKREKDIAMLRKMGPKSVLDNGFVILFIGLLLIAVFVGVAYVVPVNISEVKMVIMGAGIAWVLLSLIQIFSRRSKLHKLLEEIEIEQSFEEAKTGVAAGEKASVEARLEQLKAKEEEIINQRKQQEETLKELTEVKEKIQQNEVELEAIDLAISTLQDLSEEIYASFGSLLNKQVSSIISKITKGRYSEVKIDDQLQIMVKSGNTFISMDYLSTGTVEQIYFALRLSIAGVLIPEDMPIVMDDTFITYDYQRMNDALRCLTEYVNRQIVIFTGNPGIQDMFTNLGVTSNYISL